MAAMVCQACTTLYAVDAPCCPHCGAPDDRALPDWDPAATTDTQAATEPASTKRKTA